MMNTIFTKQREKMLQIFTATALIFGVSVFSLATQAQTFGKLFTSQEEREYLDYLREDFVARSQLTTFDINEDIIPDIPDAIVTEEVAPEVVTYKFGGIMTRINGNKMVWLNGKQIAERDLPSNFSLVNTNLGMLLSINSDGRRFQLKPGQSINMQSGLVTDSYQSSNIPDNPASAENPTTVLEAIVEPVQAEIPIIEKEQELDEDELNLDGEELDDAQKQQVLDILREQANRAE